MALKLKIKQEDFDKLSDDFKKEYKKDGDSYVLDWEESDGLTVSNVSELQSALTGARKEAKEAKQSLGGLQSVLGDRDTGDLAKQLEILDKYGDPSKLKPEDQVKAQLDSLKDSLVKGFETEKGKLEEGVGHWKELAMETFFEAKYNAAFANEAFEGSATHLLKGPVSDKAKVVEQDGKLKLSILDENGNERLAPGGTSSMTLDQLLTEMKDQPEFGRAFGAPSESGGGGLGSTGRRGSKDGKHVIGYEDARNVQKYREAKAAAEKDGQDLQIDYSSQPTS